MPKNIIFLIGVKNMQLGMDEGFFLKDGQKSSIHCLRQTRNRKGHYSSIHYHNYIEILYAIDCDAKVWINEKIYTFRSGDICFINPLEAHYVFSERGWNDYFVIKFLPQILSYDGQTASEIRYLVPIVGKFQNFDHLIQKDELKNKNVDFIMNNILKEWNEEKSGYEFLIRGQILQLFCYIARIWEKKSDKKFFSSNDNENVKIIHHAVNYTIENLASVTEREAAEFSHMSYSYFSRCFKNVMGRNFTKFLSEIKIAAAKRLLLATNKSITEISMETGFSSSSHFISNFRKIEGTTPLAYRKNADSIHKLITDPEIAEVL